MIDISFLPTSSLKKWCPTSKCLELELVIGFCASGTAPWLSSNVGMQVTPTTGNMKRHTCLKNKTFLTTSASATYFVCVVESVTQFCVLDYQDTQAPPHTTIPPETDLLSAAALA